MNDVRLLESIHPASEAQQAFDTLVGIDELKDTLLDELAALLGSDRLTAWQRRHHPGGLALANRWQRSSPLVLLSGDVGCGKTALAALIGTPLAKVLDRRLVTLETPSDLRGWGHVGEMSARITDAFVQARKRAREIRAGLLVIDEADDVGTARSQMQAHHEDRAGLNVLIKQIDQLTLAKDPLAVILITNRQQVLDPAVRRRTALHLTFARPDSSGRAAVFRHVLAGLTVTEHQIDHLTRVSERVTPFSFSDLADRLARAVLREAQRRDRAVSVDLVAECLDRLEPSPLMETQQ